MTIHCTAVYENGVLRPLIPPGLAEGQQVQVIIVTGTPAVAPSAPADILAAIASLPVEGGGDPLTSRDHDQILYGENPP
jgi:predicted DNA-binding antitoxin AbrB/MazE fold protein